MTCLNPSGWCYECPFLKKCDEVDPRIFEEEDGEQ